MGWVGQGRYFKNLLEFSNIFSRCEINVLLNQGRGDWGRGREGCGLKFNSQPVKKFFPRIKLGKHI